VNDGPAGFRALVYVKPANDSVGAAYRSETVLAPFATTAVEDGVCRAEANGPLSLCVAMPAGAGLTCIAERFMGILAANMGSQTFSLSGVLAAEAAGSAMPCLPPWYQLLPLQLSVPQFDQLHQGPPPSPSPQLTS
jgi:hypothetical protein